MSDLKTRPNKASVEEFLSAVENDKRREDSLAVLEMMRQITGKEPVMWGPSIIGFDEYHYKYDSGREGDFFIIGLSPRKQALTIYIMAGFERFTKLMGKLGKYKTGKSCLYVKKLEDVDQTVLRQLIEESYRHMCDKYHS